MYGTLLHNQPHFRDPDGDLLIWKKLSQCSEDDQRLLFSALQIVVKWELVLTGKKKGLPVPCLQANPPHTLKRSLGKLMGGWRKTLAWSLEKVHRTYRVEEQVAVGMAAAGADWGDRGLSWAICEELCYQTDQGLVVLHKDFENLITLSEEVTLAGDSTVEIRLMFWFCWVCLAWPFCHNL